MMDMDAMRPVLAGLCRHFLTMVGGMMVSSGYMQSSDSSAFIGGGMVVAGLAWSWWQKRGMAEMEAVIKKMTAPVAKILLVAFAVSLFYPAAARAADLAAGAVKNPKFNNPFSQAYDLTRCGAYFGINTLGTAGAVTGDVAPGTQIVQGAIGGTLGYGCPINAANGSFWFVEALADITNLNGNTVGLALAGPASFTERFGVGSPINSMLGMFPGLGSGPAVPNLPTLPGGITAGAGNPYIFVALHEQDVSASLGLDQNKQWLISPGVGLGMRYRLSNGVVADTFAEYKAQTNRICVGPLGAAGCAKLGSAAMVGFQLLY